MRRCCSPRWRHTIGSVRNRTGATAEFTYPGGMDIQVFPLAALLRSAAMTNDPLDHEHVTLHIRNHPELFRHLYLIAPADHFWPDLDLSVDEPDDYRFLKKLIEHFGDTNPFFLRPNDVARDMTPVPSQDERELLGDSGRAGHVERGSGIRHVANSTINAGTAELNRSGLQYTVPRRDSLFVHTSHLVVPA